MSLTLWHRQFRNPIFLVLRTCYSEVQLVTSAAVSLLGALAALHEHLRLECLDDAIHFITPYPDTHREREDNIQQIASTCELQCESQ